MFQASSAGGSNARHVALVIETARGCGRRLLKGVAEYNNHGPQWSICFEPHSPADQPPGWLRQWRGDGLLVQVRNKRVADVVRNLDVPTVDLRGGNYPIEGVPSVGVDFEAVARMAFDHLYSRGFREFGYCGLVRGKDPRRDRKGDAFVRLAREQGCPCHVLRLRSNKRRGNVFVQFKDQIAEWAESLPKPVAVVTVDHPLGLHFLDACRRTGIAVPDEIAMLSSGNDDFVCNLSIPAQTSVDVASDRIGYEAAALLDRMMQGEIAPQERLWIKPRGVTTRASTDVLAIRDPEVVTALQYIRQNACRPITVRDVLDHVALSRGVLEPRLKVAVGRTIHQDIRRVQIERAKQLLSSTEWPIKQIARSSGFQTTQYLTRVFHKTIGTTPAEYRRQEKF